MSKTQQKRVQIPDSYYILRAKAIGELGLSKAAFRLSETTHEEGFATVSMGEIFEAQFLTDETSKLTNVFEISNPLMVREDLSQNALEQRFPIVVEGDFGYKTLIDRINNRNEYQQDDSDPEILITECLRLRKLQLYLHKSTKYITPFIKTVKYAALKENDLS